MPEAFAVMMQESDGTQEWMLNPLQRKHRHLS